MTDPTPHPPLAILADQLARGWWIQGSFVEEAGACLVGWLEDIFTVDLRDRQLDLLLPLLLGDRAGELTEAVDLLLDEIGAGPFDTLREGLGALVEFNDAPETTLEDVMLVVKRAASRAPARP